MTKQSNAAAKSPTRPRAHIPQGIPPETVNNDEYEEIDEETTVLVELEDSGAPEDREWTEAEFERAQKKYLRKRITYEDQMSLPKTKHMNKIPKYCESLFTYLRLKRGANSNGEKYGFAWILETVKDIENRRVKNKNQPFDACFIDKFGNLIVSVDDAPVLWSCHTDTVHRRSFGFKQEKKETLDLQYIKYENGYIQVDHEKNEEFDLRSNCLGADDGVGVWLMLEMLRHRVSGTYVFHREEEIGGNGSRYILRTREHFLKRFKFAIAFDRMGVDEIITHQGGQRACSDEFAKSLAEQLNYEGVEYYPSDRGVFTDTKTYYQVIPECTNIGVGYYDQHGPMERLDLHHVINLRKKLLTIDVSKLVEARNLRKKSVFEDMQGNDKSNFVQIFFSRNATIIMEMLEDYGITLDDVVDYVVEKNCG